MSKQKHDLGHRKHLQAIAGHNKDNESTNTETLARKLVDRDLCSRQILELPYRPARE